MNNPEDDAAEEPTENSVTLTKEQTELFKHLIDEKVRGESTKEVLGIIANTVNGVVGNLQSIAERSTTSAELQLKMQVELRQQELEAYVKVESERIKEESEDKKRRLYLVAGTSATIALALVGTAVYLFVTGKQRQRWPSSLCFRQRAGHGLLGKTKPLSRSAKQNNYPLLMTTNPQQTGGRGRRVHGELGPPTALLGCAP